MDLCPWTPVLDVEWIAVKAGDTTAGCPSAWMLAGQRRGESLEELRYGEESLSGMEGGVSLPGQTMSGAPERGCGGGPRGGGGG